MDVDYNKAKVKGKKMLTIKNGNCLLFFSFGGGFSGVLAVALLLDDRDRLVFKLLLDFSFMGSLLGIFLLGDPGDPLTSLKYRF